MQVIAQWTGAQADALRQALRMTIEGFAGRLGVAPRTAAYWRKQPATIPQAAVQLALDAALESSSDRVKAQFALLLGETAEEESVKNRVRPTVATLDASGPDTDEQARIQGVLQSSSRLDDATIHHLTQGLYSHRHAEDSLGPHLMIAPMSAQLDMLVALLRETSGQRRPALMHLVSDWLAFVGWLHTALGDFPKADAVFADAEKLSDELGDGVLASTATSYRGYIALLQGQYRQAVRATAGALATPSAHPTQIAYDTLQLAQSYAGLGDFKEAKNLLLRASDSVTNAGDPPESLYWYTEPFLRMNIGLTQHAIGQNREAVDSISSGMSALDADQKNAEWLAEYQQALDDATVADT